MSEFTPWDWQIRDLENLREHDYTGMIAIETGGGKTALGCLVIEDLKPEVTLIIAPESTLIHENKGWVKALRQINGIEMRKIGNGKKAERQALDDFLWGYPGVYATTPQFMGRKTTDTSLWSGDLLIADEIHQMATPGSKGQRKLSGYDPVKDYPLSNRFSHRLALSGTPMRQNFQNMWASMRFLWSHLYRRGQVAYDNFIFWAEERMTWVMVTTSRRNKWGEKIKVRQFQHEKEPGKLLREMPCVIVHKRREPCCEAHPNGFLPTDAPVEVVREVELTIVQKRAIRELEDHMMTFIKDNPLVVEIPLTQKQRIRQVTLGEPTIREYTVYDEKKRKEVVKTTLDFDPECKSPFIEEVIGILTNELDENEPVMIYLESQRFAEVVVHRLRKAGFTTEEYSGVRKPDLEGFGKDYQVLVGIMAAIGTGTDGLQDNCQTEIVLEEPVSLTNKTQAYSRLDRLGGKQVLRYIIQDSEGVAQGRLSQNIEKQLLINQSMRMGR